MKVLSCVLSCLLMVSVISGPVSAQSGVSDEAKQAMQKGIAAVDKAASLEDLDKAISHFAQALAAAPQWADACQNLARVLSMKPGREEEAIKLLNRYLELNPQATDKAEVIAEIKNTEAKLKVVNDQKFMLNYIEFASLPDGIYVVGVKKPSRMGFRHGTKIISINNKPTKGMSLAEFYRIMKEGPEDEFVCFNNTRPASSTIDIDGYKRKALFDPNVPRSLSSKKNEAGGWTSCIGGGACCE